ncbi:MAG: hypothetical protein WCI73_13180, partial [Phycisphaerae bacterium]
MSEDDDNDTPATDTPDNGDQCAAILMKGGPDDSTREIQETFDFWRYTTDTKEILAADDCRLVMADTAEELQRKLDAKYIAPPGCSYLLDGSHEICLSCTIKESRWTGYTRSIMNRKTLGGWVVLKYPLVVDYIDHDQVRQLTIQYGPVLLHKDDANPAKLLDAGFSPVGGGFELTKVRWNPKAVALRGWRKQVREVEVQWVDKFDESLLQRFADCFNPCYWNKFPFSGILGFEDKSPSIHSIREYMKLAQRLRPGSRPWRKADYSGGTYYTAVRVKYKTAPEALLPSIRTALKKGDIGQTPVAKIVLSETEERRENHPTIPILPYKPP